MSSPCDICNTVYTDDIWSEQLLSENQARCCPHYSLCKDCAQTQDADKLRIGDYCPYCVIEGEVSIPIYWDSWADIAYLTKDILVLGVNDEKIKKKRLI